MYSKDIDKLIEKAEVLIEALPYIQKYNRRIIVPKLVKLQKIFVYRMIVKMRRYYVRVYVVCRVLDRAKFVNVITVRNNDDSTGVLSRSPFNAHTACRKAF